MTNGADHRPHLATAKKKAAAKKASKPKTPNTAGAGKPKKWRGLLPPL